MNIEAILNKVHRLENHRDKYRAYVYRQNGLCSVTPRVELLTADMYADYKLQNMKAIERVQDLPEQLFEVVWFDHEKPQPNFDECVFKNEQAKVAEEADYENTLSDFRDLRWV